MQAAWRGVSGPVEQVASAFLGGALLTIGLGRRSLGGSALALAGGGLLYRSLRGREQPAHVLERAIYRRAARHKAATQQAGM